MRTHNNMIDDKTVGHPHPMLTVFPPAGSKLPHVDVYSTLDGAIAAFSLDNALDQRAEVSLAIIDDPTEGVLWFSILAGHGHAYSVDTTLFAAREWKNWWQRENNVVIDDTGTIVSQS